MLVLWLQLALSAASPIYRGYLADIDCRWQVISCSVDDRTEEERGLKVGGAVEIGWSNTIEGVGQWKEGGEAVLVLSAVIASHVM